MSQNMDPDSQLNLAQHDHQQVDMGMMMMMPMYFWSGNDVTYLFKGISSDSTGTYVAGIIGVFVLAVVVEGVSYLRKYIHVMGQLKGINDAVRVAQNAPVLDVQISIVFRLVLSLIYLIMVSLGFFLMLIVMTFNVYLILAAVTGLIFGNLVFNLISLPTLPL